MTSENNKRIAKNTLFLYFRQILTLVINLYTIRVILNVLGVEDYGIYNVVAGIVSLLSFLSGSMASATQRFFAFSLGKKDFDSLKKIFSINLLIYFLIAIAAFVILESIGFLFVNSELNVPSDRLDAVQTVYHFAVLTLVLTIFTSPFIAIILAYEDMKIYAYAYVVEALMKLSIVFLLKYIPMDKLELYGILLFTVAIINSVIYITICARKYKECQFRSFYWDKKVLSNILGFIGWTLFGQLSSVVRNQAVTILLNQMFNPIVVASKAIANNITGQISAFSSNFNVGIYPPMIKSYAAGNKEEMFSLIFNGSKITFFLMWVFTLPLFLEMDTIFQLWLMNPPPEAILFTRLALIEVLINSVSLPLTSAARAPGKMKMYEMTLGAIQIMIFFISWIVLMMGAEAYAVFIVAIIFSLIMFLVRLHIVSSLIELPINMFFKRVIIPVIGVLFISLIFSGGIHLYLPKGLLYACVSVLFSGFISCLCMFYIGMNKCEQAKVQGLIINRIKRYF